MRIAAVIATRATCNRAQVGVVVVDATHHILTGGYNGAAPGEPHCPPDESLRPEDHCTRAIHAEQNAIVHAEKSLVGATWYFYPFGPCPSCMLLVRASRPARLVFAIDYAKADYQGLTQ